MFRNLYLDTRRTALLFWACLKLAIGLAFPWRAGAERPAVLFRRTLQSLGMTYLKLGQFLALRIDLLPREVCAELAKLFEHVTPMSAADVRFVIEAEAQAPMEEVFGWFRWEPIAAASVAQVHEAHLANGERVAVKVQRRDLAPLFTADMRNLKRLAVVLDFFHVVGAIRVKDVADEFANFTRRELDFFAEAQAAARMREDSVSGEIIPRIIWSLTTRRLLTMDFVDGVSLARIKELMESGKMETAARLAPGLDLCESMRNLATASLHQLLVTGFFHADLHPGNVLLCPGNRVAFLDFGIFGTISPEQRELLANHIEQIALGNIDESFRHYARLFTPTERTDYSSYQREVKTVMNRWFEASRSTDTPTEERMVAKFSDEMFTVVRKHHLTMGMDTLLFWRALIILDATVLQMCPGFDLLKELRAFFLRVRPGIVARVKALTRDEVMLDMLELGGRLPVRLEDWQYYLASGKFRPNLTLEESPELRERDNRRVEAIVLAIFGLSVGLLKRAAPGIGLRAACTGLALGMILLGMLRLRRAG